MLNRWQAITWTNVLFRDMYIYAPLDLNEFILYVGLKKCKYTFVFYNFSTLYCGISSWNHSSRKSKNYLTYIANTIAAEDLAPLLLTRCDFNTLRPRQNGRHFPDDTFKRIFLNENVRISIKISLKFVAEGPINNIQALVQIMAWRRPGDKPLSEPMMVRLPTHICVTRPQWVNPAMDK